MSEHSSESGQPQGMEGTLEAGVSGDAEPEQDLQPGTVVDPDDTEGAIQEVTEESEGGS
jgi:hypothetical protein